MELLKQVSSQEPSQKLKELGVKQESTFYYHNDKCKFNLLPNVELPKADNICSAFTVAELIYMLQSVTKEDIIVGWSDDNVADHLAQQLCTKLQNLKENAGSGLTQ